MELPILRNGDPPIRHADCCLALSTKLLSITASELSNDIEPDRASIVLSVGSGTGLLEAMLIQYLDSTCHQETSRNLSIEGIEVQQLNDEYQANKYLPEYAINTVRGTWNLSSRLDDPDVSGLMFVYPREKSLVSKYLEAISSKGSKVQTVIWLGPQADWSEFEPCFQIATPNGEKLFERIESRVGDDVGIAPYEVMVIARRHPRH